MTGARLDRLRIRNCRVLPGVEFVEVTPLTTLIAPKPIDPQLIDPQLMDPELIAPELIGPTGSGKSPVLDALAFLHEAVTTGLEPAWRSWGGMRVLRDRDAAGPIEIEIAYRERPGSQLVTYQLAVDEESGAPVVVSELLRWSVPPAPDLAADILRFERGAGTIVDEATGARVDERLRSPGQLAVSTLGCLARHTQVAVLRQFIADWSPRTKDMRTKDMLPNAIQTPSERRPEQPPIVGAEAPENSVDPRFRHGAADA
jgi:hypothetical protein